MLDLDIMPKNKTVPLPLLPLFHFWKLEVRIIYYKDFINEGSHTCLVICETIELTWWIMGPVMLRNDILFWPKRHKSKHLQYDNNIKPLYIRPFIYDYYVTRTYNFFLFMLSCEPCPCTDKQTTLRETIIVTCHEKVRILGLPFTRI